MTDAPLPPLTPEEEAEALAAELALGLLDGDELVAAQALMATDPDFAALVRDWQERLSPMVDELTLVMAPARAKVMIDRALGHAKPPQVQPELRGPVPLMRWLMGAMLAAAVVLGVIYLPPILRGGPEGVEYASQLVADDRGLQVRAVMSSADHMLEVVLEQGAIPEDRDYELWWIDAEGATPVSLGLVPHSGSARIAMPEGLTPTESTVIALSDEPSGGSPTGQATGPVITSAPLTIL